MRDTRKALFSLAHPTSVSHFMHCSTRRYVERVVGTIRRQCLGSAFRAAFALAELASRITEFARAIDDSLRLDDEKRRAPFGLDLGFRPLHRPMEHAELVAQSKDFKLKRRTGAEGCQECRQQGCEYACWHESTEDEQLPFYQADPDF